MALAKDQRLDQNSAMCFNHAHTSYYGNEFGGSSIQGFYGINKKVFEEGDKNLAMSNSSSLSSPSSSNSSGLVYQTLKYQQSEEGNSVINFKGGYGNFPHTSGSSLLNFDHQNEQFHQSCFSNQEDFSIWGDNNYQNHQLVVNSKCINPNPLLESPNKMQTTRRSLQFGIQDLGKEETSLNNKRPYVEESVQPKKKQCTTNPTKQTTPKSSPSKDPQSIAAKNRRERISERLKVLQELVPNGSKVDLVTMLEKAIGYVKFLQLQVKVLATDEFWPAQGGKAPNLSQVKEAIDAILLASQRDA